MVGNDIIDIKRTRLDSNWSRQGFLQKVFNQQEQILIEQASDPFTIVWRMWSMKESAYKLYLQLNPTQARIFCPSKIACQLECERQGVVTFNGMFMNTRTRMNSEYIFTCATLIASDRVDSNIVHLINSDPLNQTDCTHKNLIKYICKTQGIKKTGIEIRKSQRAIPRVYYNNQAMAIDISMTHHGNYGAFSIMKS